MWGVGREEPGKSTTGHTPEFSAGDGLFTSQKQITHSPVAGRLLAGGNSTQTLEPRLAPPALQESL